MSNAKQAKPELIVKLDRERKLVLSFRGLRRVEEMRGHSLFKCVSWNELGFRDLSMVLWVGLLGEDPTLTQDQSDELWDLYGIASNFEALMDYVNEVIERAMPTLSADDKAALNAQKKTFEGKLTKTLKERMSPRSSSIGSNSGPAESASSS